MKKILLFAVPVFFFAACNPVTELAVKNGSESQGTISDVVWNHTDGQTPAVAFANDAAVGAQTESKETDVLDGQITCAVDDGSDLFIAEVIVASTGSQSASLNEGESNVLTVKATSSGSLASLRKK